MCLKLQSFYPSISKIYLLQTLHPVTPSSSQKTEVEQKGECHVNENKKRYLLKISKEIHKQIKMEAARSGKTMNDLMVDAIKKSLKDKTIRRHKTNHSNSFST